ncbi:MAG TPA: vWA domain-containing protein [Candidatus Nanoarchaeia archaeon]|nr:vWA domain-containing protein [Candidatus Nanoarchaeia archaeon]
MAFLIAALLALTAFSANAFVITKFDGDKNEKNIAYINPPSTECFDIIMPKSCTVNSASMTIEGKGGTSGNTADVVLVTDLSGSMSWDCTADPPDICNAPNGNSCRINAVKGALATFLDTVNMVDVGVGMAAFSTCSGGGGITHDKDLLIPIIDTYEPGGATNIGGGVDRGIQALSSSTADKKYIIIFSDGEPTAHGDCELESTATGCGPWPIAAAYALQKIGEAQSKGIIVVSVNPTDASSWANLDDVYRDLANDINTGVGGPRVSISSSSPLSLSGWQANEELKSGKAWINNGCGGAPATCTNYKDILQQNINACTEEFCTVKMCVLGETKGQVRLSGLSIDLPGCPPGKLKLRDSSVAFAYPSLYIDYPIEIDMVEQYIVLGEKGGLKFEMGPSDCFNFAFSGPSPTTLRISPKNKWKSCIEIVKVKAFDPLYPDLGKPEANLVISYKGGGELKCKNSTVKKLLRPFVSNTSMKINDTFEVIGEPGKVIKIEEDSSDKLDLSLDGPDYIKVRNNKLIMDEIVHIKVTTDNDIVSENCPVHFYAFNANCFREVCDQCTNYTCLLAKGCIDQNVSVFNRGSTMRTSRMLPPMSMPYEMKSFYSLSPKFNITSLDSRNSVFLITGNNASHNYKNASIMNVSLGEMGSARACAELTRLSFDVGKKVADPGTDLLVTGSKSVAGYFESDGVVFSQGPYIFTAKIWQKK